MNEQPRLTLTDTEQTILDFARRDLESAHAADLAQMPAASLILTVERLRTRLDSVLELLDDVSDPQPPGGY
jgi:hypothetical protein